MVAIKKKRLGKSEYYYLEHTYRENGKVQKEEKYMGKEIPENIEKLKKDFLHQIYETKWYARLNTIKKHFFQEEKKIPSSAKEKEIFSIKFTYNTQRIEGSTLTLRETANLLERGITPRAKPIRDIKEAEAHKKVFYETIYYKKDLSLQIVLYWHKRLFEQTTPEIAGKLRQHQVAISGSKFLPPSAVEVYLLLEEFFKWYQHNKGKIHPVELAALVHLKFVTIHPFSDGNRRVSRLLMNFVLHKRNFPFLDIPYENRSSYYTALERAQVKGEEKIFVQWFFKRYIKEHSRFLK